MRVLVVVSVHCEGVDARIGKGMHLGVGSPRTCTTVTRAVITGLGQWMKCGVELVIHEYIYKVYPDDYQH